MRIVFAGSPSIAVPAFETLCEYSCEHSCEHSCEYSCEHSLGGGIEMAGVLTNPDSPKGRSGTPLPTEVGEAAARAVQKFEGQGRAIFPVLKPEKLDAQARELIAALKPDLLVSFAYGRIFGPKFLALFPHGGINVHPSLLPKYRGPSPIQAAILNRDCVTGITVQKLAAQMDEGDILAQEQFQLTGAETSGSLGEIMAQKAALILPAVLENIASGNVKGKAQNHSEASYCTLVSREDALINWKAGATEIEAKVRAFDPWPLCRTLHKGRELFILRASVYEKDAAFCGKSGPACVLGIDKQDGILVQTGEGILAVTELQYQGKKALMWKDFLNGARDFTGSQLGEGVII